MIYHLPFRDWMELDSTPQQSIAAEEEGASDSGDGGR